MSFDKTTLLLLLLVVNTINCSTEPLDKPDDDLDDTTVEETIDEENNFNRLIRSNREWAKSKTQKDLNFFKNHAEGQTPKYLWIGCSDSRVPPNQLLGLDVGEVFVLRNVANMVFPSDISTLAVIQYSVEVLKVEDIIVAGHYGCGGVKAALTKNNFGTLEAWLSKLRKIRHNHAKAFEGLKTIDEKVKTLV